MATASSAIRTWRAARSHSEYTATEAIPMSRHARMIRTAISPRFATRILRKTLRFYFRTVTIASIVARRSDGEGAGRRYRMTPRRTA